jgi:hypothetical protein
VTSQMSNLYFQRRRSLLGPTIGVCFGLLLGSALLFTQPVGSVAWIIIAAAIALNILALGFGAVMRLGLKRPMLTLHDRYLIYRKTAIPWSRVANVSPIDIGSGQLLGITITDGGRDILYLTKRESVRKLLIRKNQKLLDTYGALIVPPATGVSVPELCEKISDFQKSRVDSEDLSDSSLL